MSRILEFYRGKILHPVAVPASRPRRRPAADPSGGMTIAPVEWFAALQRVYVAHTDTIGRTAYECWREAVE